MILRNSIKCNHCNDEIESKHRHDFVTCTCHKVGVDGVKIIEEQCLLNYLILQILQ
jgi:hypothetical protein